jgi:large subunit ribosomal protein L1
MANRSRKYNKAKSTMDRIDGPVSIPEAVRLVKSFKPANFDQTVDCVLQLGIDPKQADQIVRGSVSLPHGIGKHKAVVAFCEEGDVEAAKAAGAAEAGSDELIKKITDGWSDFDVAVADPKLMSKVSKLGRILGPHGKMPSPKNGTVTADVTKAVAEFAAGKVEFKNDAGGNVHAVVGRQSFEADKLVENVEAFVAHIRKIKPASAKGAYIKRASLSATMSPGVAVAV